MWQERDSLGVLGYRYERSKHFARPIMPDGSPAELIGGQNLYHDMLTIRTFPGFEKMFSDYMLPFTSGGTHEVLVGDTLTGATSGATCEVVSIQVDSGTWAGGDAAGYFFVKSVSGTFVAENLDEGANPNVCTIAAAPTEIQLGSSGKRTCVGCFQYIKADGTIYIIICYPDRIYSYKAGDNSPEEITGSVTLTGSNANQFKAAYWADTSTGSNPWIILTNGVDVPIKWTGSGNCAVLGGTPPIGSHICAFAGHIFLSNVTSGGNDYAQRDQWSDVDAAETWAGALTGSNDLRGSDGEIQGSMIFGDLRFIFKEFSTTVQRHTGYDPPFIFDEDELPIGVLAPATVGKAMKYDYGFFMGHDQNFYVIRKDGGYFPVGDNILMRIRDYANDDNLKYAFAVYHPGLDQIILGVPSTNTSNGYCDVLFMFDLGYYILTGEKVWSTPIVTGKNFTAGTPAKFRQAYRIGDLGDVSSDGKIGGLAGTVGNLYQEASYTEVILADNDGYTYRLDDGVFYYDTTLISWEAEFKDVHLSTKQTHKFRLMEYELLYRNPATMLASWNLYESYDGGGSYGAANTISPYDSSGAEDEELSYSVYLDSVAKIHRIKITGTYPAKIIGQRWLGTQEGRY